MSSYRQQTHSSTRDSVLIAHAADMLSRTSMSKEDFAEALSKALYSMASEKASSKDVPDLEAMTQTSDHQTYSRVAGSWLKKVQRWLDGSVELPAWIEEAWVQSLLPDWRERCLIELAGRYGLLAVRAVGVDGVCAMTAFSGLVGHFGDAAGAGGQILADGRIDHIDAPHLPGFALSCRALAAHAVAMAEKAEKVSAEIA
ncbi:hypothetical protein [Pseudomonas sp. NBRC 111135]|uniref:hypothetical protein n=1 Tax=Pseudomonas sp. NBRC 111135 TaxID=1661050 RepID=UPI0006D3B587|nr:hypothetical protein [Pseudomonas sp. NBRC 111135]